LSAAVEEREQGRAGRRDVSGSVNHCRDVQNLAIL